MGGQIRIPGTRQVPEVCTSRREADRMGQVPADPENGLDAATRLCQDVWIGRIANESVAHKMLRPRTRAVTICHGPRCGPRFARPRFWDKKSLSRGTLGPFTLVLGAVKPEAFVVDSAYTSVWGIDEYAKESQGRL